jgi:hypothetical protein
MSLTNGQWRLIATFVEHGLTDFDKAEAAFNRNDTGQIEAWKTRLTKLGIRAQTSEATGYYDRQGLARKR